MLPRALVVFAGALVAFAVLSAAQCTGFSDCSSCAAQPLCGWCPGGGVNGTGVCVRGGPDGPFSSADCGPSCGSTSDDFVYTPAMCAASCFTATSAAHCMEQKHCVYCANTAVAPSTRIRVLPADGGGHAYPVGFAATYTVPATSRGVCFPAGPGGQPDMRAAYDVAVSRGANIGFELFVNQTGTCVGTPMSVPDAGTASARRSALSAAQPMCNALATSAACVLQKGCGWCRSTRRCQAFHHDAATDAITAFDPSTCGPPSTDVVVSKPDQLVEKTGFCESLTPMGCRSCTDAG